MCGDENKAIDHRQKFILKTKKKILQTYLQGNF